MFRICSIIQEPKPKQIKKNILDIAQICSLHVIETGNTNIKRRKALYA